MRTFFERDVCFAEHPLIVVGNLPTVRHPHFKPLFTGEYSRTHAALACAEHRKFPQLRVVVCGYCWHLLPTFQCHTGKDSEQETHYPKTSDYFCLVITFFLVLVVEGCHHKYQAPSAILPFRIF